MDNQKIASLKEAVNYCVPNKTCSNCSHGYNHRSDNGEWLMCGQLDNLDTRSRPWNVVADNGVCDNWTPRLPKPKTEEMNDD